MKKCIIFIIFTLILSVGAESLTNPFEKEQVPFSLEGLSGLERIHLSREAKSILKQNGFVVTPGFKKEIYDIYTSCKQTNQPIFITTDAVLHTSHIFFDYLLRILEIEKLYDLANELTDRMLGLSEKELKGMELSREEYDLIWNIGSILASLKRFPNSIMTKITSGTDARMDIAADVHTDLNTKKVLEEAVGSPFNIYVIIKDTKGYRLCQGGVFSYYEFKHPMDDRLTDEKWQDMGEKKKRPNQPDWTNTFITKRRPLS